MMASNYSTMLKFSELFRLTHSFTEGCKGSLHGWDAGFYIPVVMRLKTPNTFMHIVYSFDTLTNF